VTGFCLDPHRQLTTHPPDPLAGFKGVTLQAERTGKGGQGREGTKEGKERRDHPHTTNSWIRHCYQQLKAGVPSSHLAEIS